MIYLELLLVTSVVIYIVDLSGFTQGWRTMLAKWLNISESSLKPLPPFDCSKCAVWWIGIIYCLCTDTISLPIIAYIALLSYMSIPIGQFFIFVREATSWVITKMFQWYE